MSGEPKLPAVTYQVGYKRPPAAGQFKKGVSGNPRGRPRKDAKAPARTAAHAELDDILLKEALRPITVRENDQVIVMPMIQAVMRSMGVAAVKGHYKSQLALTHMVKAVQADHFETRRSLFVKVLTYKQEWAETFAECDRRGVPRPEPVPHPDEMIVDMNTMEVRYNGPESMDDKAKWDDLLRQKADALETIAELEPKVRRRSRLSEFYQQEIDLCRDLVRMVDTVIPDEKTRRRPGFDIKRWRESRPYWEGMKKRALELERKRKGGR